MSSFYNPLVCYYLFRSAFQFGDERSQLGPGDQALFAFFEFLVATFVAQFRVQALLYLFRVYLSMLNFGHNQCKQCYNVPPRCEHGRDNTQVCKGFTPDADANRLASGNMTVEFMGTLDNNVRSVQGNAMDVLSGHTVAGLVPFTAGSAGACLCVLTLRI